MQESRSILSSPQIQGAKVAGGGEGQGAAGETQGQEGHKR